MMSEIVNKDIMENLQKDLNELVLEHAEDAKTLLNVASVLFASSLKCYQIVLGEEGVVRFLKMTLNDVEQAQTKLH